jgi:hypothetical protein
MSNWKPIKIGARATHLRADCYYEWTRATKFVYYGTAAWLPVLIELRETNGSKADAQALAERIFKMQAEDKKKKEGDRSWASQLRVPAFFASRPKRLSRPTKFLSVLATRQFLDDVYGGKDPADSIRGFEIGQPTAYSSVEKMRANPHRPPKKGREKPPEVVIGIIDDGLAFAHDRFKSADGTTRIEYFWDQQTPHPFWYDLTYGRVIDKRSADGIDQRMNDSRHGSLVDEDELYRRSGHIDQLRSGHKPLTFHMTHGTHVMDVACNPADARPAAGARPIIAVQLPTATVADTSGGTLTPQILNGLWYIVDRAEAIATATGVAQLPIVANVSYGLIAGPHDGSSMLETAIDDLLEACNSGNLSGVSSAKPLRLVLPAGNSHLSRCHARFDLDAGASQELRWRVLSDDWTESYLEIWFPNGSDALTVRLTAPDGDASVAFSAGVGSTYQIGGNVVAEAKYYAPGEVGKLAMLRLTLAPTAWPDGGKPLAPAGLWRIKVDNAAGDAEVRDIHAWIQRDDAAPGYKQRGRQSYFDDPLYAKYDDGGRLIEKDSHPMTLNSYVKRCGTINAIATGRGPIVVGGIRRSDWAPAPYSAAGPVTNHPPGRGAPNPKGPDVMTVCEESPSHHGLVAAGTRSGSAGAMHGTSVAAPRIACWIAEELAAGRPGDRNAVSARADAVVAPPQYSDRNPPAGATPKPSEERGGSGRIEFGPHRQRTERR